MLHRNQTRRICGPRTHQASLRLVLLVAKGRLLRLLSHAHHWLKLSLFVDYHSHQSTSNVVAIAAAGHRSLAIVQPLAYRPTILSGKISQGNLLFSWPAIPSRTYRLQFKSSLDETVWKDLPWNIAASGDTATASESLSATSRFYRLLFFP